MISKVMKQFSTTRKLARDENQAQLLGKYAIDFLKNGNPSQAVMERCKQFHTDSVFCGISALAMKTNAPTVLKAEALTGQKGNSNRPTPGYSRCLGSSALVPFEKACLANASAVREWDSNGTVFGYNANVPGHTAGEFGHNDFYSVVLAAAHQNKDINGNLALKAMVLQDEIRGRLCEVFSLKTYKIDHVVHGAIASICVYGALMGATALEIEHAIGMYCAHYIPFRAIRAGKQLSDSKGASAAIATEAALNCIRRSMNGFIGPKDIFRNPEAIFRLNEPTNGDSPFDIVVSEDGDDFAVMGMHFKLGLYEHQSAGALEAIQKLLFEYKFVEHNNIDIIENIEIVCYEPAFGIIGDPAKRTPGTRQSADHSMVYIVSTMLRKAIENPNFNQQLENKTLNDVWTGLMLEPQDYSYPAVFNQTTRKLMDKIVFTHGGKSYDDKYPEGIPTSVKMTLKGGKVLDSSLVMFPSGHARNTDCDLKGILSHKFNLLGNLALANQQDVDGMMNKLNSIDTLSNDELQNLYDCDIRYHEVSVDDEKFVPKL